jgi:NADH:ubiquinone oxidoreductase subunit 6 (subunit J)
MTAVLQLLVFVAAIAGLIIFGVYRDKKEHNRDTGQASIYFPASHEDDGKHRGAAMSRVD